MYKPIKSEMTMRAIKIEDKSKWNLRSTQFQNFYIDSITLTITTHLTHKFLIGFAFFEHWKMIFYEVLNFQATFLLHFKVE